MQAQVPSEAPLLGGCLSHIDFYWEQPKREGNSKDLFPVSCAMGYLSSGQRQTEKIVSPKTLEYRIEKLGKFQLFLKLNHVKQQTPEHSC